MNKGKHDKTISNGELNPRDRRDTYLPNALSKEYAKNTLNLVYSCSVLIILIYFVFSNLYNYPTIKQSNRKRVRVNRRTRKSKKNIECNSSGLKNTYF